MNRRKIITGNIHTMVFKGFDKRYIVIQVSDLEAWCQNCSIRKTVFDIF